VEEVGIPIFQARRDPSWGNRTTKEKPPNKDSWDLLLESFQEKKRKRLKQKRFRAANIRFSNVGHTAIYDKRLIGVQGSKNFFMNKIPMVWKE